MGVNKLLKAGIAGEKEQLAKASEKPKVKTAEVKEKPKKVTPIKTEEPDKKPKNKAADNKHPGGRPTNESKGKISRKQYSLTLVPDDYSRIMDLADADGLSFSKYIERAVNEYIRNHQTE
ncbi:MAG: hypothetical protein K6E63_02810 [Lachnospiraceae bacterium]|nr:hypothetical protein [Lachnospiraceae bacterium]